MLIIQIFALSQFEIDLKAGASLDLTIASQLAPSLVFHSANGGKLS
jgi:hypothetical protein